MKRILPLCLLAGLLLTGCTAAPKETSTPDATSAPDTTLAPPETDAVTFETGDTLPVLSVTTKTPDDTLAFVTEPVDRYVASQIASWTPGYEMPPEPYYEPCSVTLTMPGQEGSSIADADAEIKVRGNWTTTYAKKPLRLKFAEKQSVPGLRDGAALKNWVLLASYKDGSMLRDKTAFSIAKELYTPDGLFTPEATLVELTINGQYWGVYVLTDQIQVNADRVAITKPEKDYEGTDIGYLLEFDGYAETEDALQHFSIDYADNAPLLPFAGDGEPEQEITPLAPNRNPMRTDPGYTIKSDIYSQAQHDCIADYLDAVYRILYAAAYEDKALQYNFDTHTLEPAEGMTPQEAAQAAVDVNSLADAYILSEIACDADLYWSSFYMDVDLGKDGDRKLRFEAPWDFDSAFGNKDRCADGTGFYAASTLWDVNDNYQTINPWLAVLIHEPWFQEIIREKWTAAYDAGVFSRAGAQITADAAQHEAAFDRNEQRWQQLSHNEAVSELTRDAARCRTEAEAAAYLADWLERRVAFLNEYWHA